MYKFAKYSPKWKPSADLTQEKLRSAKAHWNAKVSEFIDDFMNFKKLFNGKPSHFHESISSLFEELPANPSTIIGVLDLDFKEITKEANKIITLQQEYSKTRRRKAASNLLSLATDRKELIKSKADWNKKSREFINDLINFIWLINGKSNKFIMQRSPITEPIPADPATIIGVLVGDFENLTKSANNIIKYQSSLYHASKKTASTSVSSLMTRQDHYFLVKEASNPLTRFVAKLTSTSFGGGPKAKIRLFRMSFLSLLPKIYKNFADFQKNVVGRSPESIVQAITIFNSLKEDLFSFKEILKDILVYIVALQEEQAKDEEPEDLEEEAEASEELEELEQDENAEPVPAAVPAAAVPAAVGPTDAPIVGPGAAAVDPEFLEKWAEFNRVKDIVREYKEKVSELEKNTNLTEQLVNMRHLVTVWENFSKAISSAQDRQKISEILDQIRELNREIMNTWLDLSKLEKNAQNRISRYVGKTLHQVPLISNETSALRIVCYENADKVREIINDMMDSLEKDLNVEFLDASFVRIVEKLNVIIKNLVTLANLVKNKIKSDVILDFLMKSRFGNELAHLDDQEIKKMRNALQSKKVREILHKLSPSPLPQVREDKSAKPEPKKTKTPNPTPPQEES